MTIATVLSITGQAWARDAEGNLRELRAGDAIQEGETLVTSDNGSVQLDFGDGLEPALIEGGQEIAMTPELDANAPVEVADSSVLDEDLEALLAALDEEDGDLLDILDATAAGAGGGGGEGGGHDFVRLARISEAVDPLSFEFGTARTAELTTPEGDGIGTLAAEVIPASAGTVSIGLSDLTLGDEGVVSGVLGFSFGSGDTGSVTFAGMDGVEAQLGQESIVYGWDGATNTLTAFSPERGATIFTIEVNPSTGAFTVTQVTNLLHEDGMDEALAGLTYTVTSGNGTTATGSLNITILDDGPSIETNAAELDGLSVDESAFGEAATADFAGAFAISLGADGEGSSSYALGIDGDGSTALVSTESGEAISLIANNDGEIEGRTESGELAFTISVNGETGAVTLTQHLALSHPDGSNPADVLSLAGSGLMLSATVTDGDNDSTTASIDLGGQLSFVDDGPQANNDLGVLQLGRFEKSGNVMANDEAGTDGAEVTSVTFNGSTVALENGMATIEGEHGILTIHADGAYTYERSETPNYQGMFSDQFTYTLTDGDGDSDTATLNVKGIDFPVGIINWPPFGQDAHLVVNEANLSDGTDPDDDALTQGGRFTVSAVDGLAQLSIAIGEGDERQELTVTRNENGSFNYSEASITVEEGYKLEITGITQLPFGGYRVSYEYTLLGNKDHSASGDDDALIRNFNITVTDRDGDTANSNLKVKVVDDAPTASLDGSNEAIEGGDTIIGSWNAESGADSQDTQQLISIDGGPEQTLQIGHAYELAEGTLTLNENGTWTFVPGTDLDHSHNQSIRFELIKIDGDNDRASDTHYIEIKDGDGPTTGDENGEGGSVTLALADAETIDGNTHSVSGELAFTAGSDAIVDFAFGDTSGIQVAGLDGELSWNLDDDGNLIGSVNDEPVLKLSLSGTDAIAAEQSGSITVTAELLDALPHDVNVDDLTISGIRVVASDRDGDSTTASVEVEVDDALPSVEGTNPSGHEVVISNLNSLAGYSSSFGYYIKGEDGNPTVGMVVWANVKHDKGASYVLEGYAPGEVGYFIIPNGANANAGLVNETDVTFQQVDGVWVAVTKDGNQLDGQNASAPVLFNDPSLNPNGASHVENNAEEGDINWEDVYGGGDKDYNDVNIKVEWKPASLTVDESKLDVTAEFDFSGYFSAEYGADGFADREYSLSVVADDANSGLVDTQTGENVLVKELDGEIVGYVVIDGEEVPVFTLTVDAETGIVTLDQLRAITHSIENVTGTSDVANVLANVVFLNKTVVDSDGDKAGAMIDIGQVIYFLDDGPAAVEDEASLDAGEFMLEEGNLLDNDQQGADGATVTAVNGTAVPVEGSIDIPGDYGVLTVAADGNYSYVRNAGTPGGVSDSFTYTLTDGDGDSDTATLSIAISDAPVQIDNDKPQGQDAHLVFNEAHLPDGTDPDAGALTQGGSFTVSVPDGVDNLSVGGQFIVEGGVEQALPTIVTASGNTLAITGYVANGDGTYTVNYAYTLNGNKDHEQPGNDESLNQSFEIVVQDTDGDTSSSNLVVQILDDAPGFGTPEDVSLGLASGSTVVGGLDLTIGADANGAEISQASLLVDDNGHVQIRYEDADGPKEAYLTSGGEKLVYTFDAANQQLIAYKAGGSAEDPVLTIDMDASGNQYAVNVLQPIDAIATSFEVKVAKVQGGGNNYVLDIDSDNLEIQFTAIGGTVNWSDQGIGVHNNWINPGETLIANFSQLMTQLDLTVGKNGDGDAISWKAYKDGQQVAEGSSDTISVASGFDRIEFTAEDEKYVIKEFSGTYLDAELDFTLPVDVVAVDGDGDTTDGAFDINFEPGSVPELPELPTILGLTDSDVTVNEMYLDGGTAEDEGDAAATGSFTLSAPEGVDSLLVAGTKASGNGEQQGDKVELTLADLEALAAGNAIVIETPQGNTLTLTGYDSATGEVSYSFELGSAVDHETGEGRNEQAKEGIEIELVDGLGNIAYGTIDVTVVDDVPESFAGVQAIQVPVSELEVGALNAGWQNVTGTSGPGRIETSNNDDGISIRWGTGSGYDFMYADGLTDSTGVASDSLFSLGTFTHNNFVIGSEGTVLDTADLEVTFSVVIDGVPTEVTTVIQLKHEETSNTHPQKTHPDNDDFISIVNPQQMQTITVGDREYQLQIKGFLSQDENGEWALVDKVRTTETKATSFELYAEIASTDDLPTVNGSVDADWGADGPAEIDSLLWSDGQGGTVANGVIEGQYGTLTVNADGSYLYEVSRDTRDGMKAGESFDDETFTYYLTDADGDVVESKLTINIAGVPNGIVASDNVATADVALVDITPEPQDPVTIIDSFKAYAKNHKGDEETRAHEFLVGEAETGQVNFFADIDPASGEASLLWSLSRKDGNGVWQEVAGIGGSANQGLNTTGLLQEGEYRVEFIATTKGGNNKWSNEYPSVNVGDASLIIQESAYQVAESNATEGNLLTDPGINGSTDIPGSSSTVLKALVGSDYLDAKEDGLAIAGQYGTFTLYANGDYRYEPEADVANVGKIDSLSYQLVHPSGATAEASLQVGITGPGVDSFVWGTDGNDTLMGGASNDIMLGGLGADTFVWQLDEQGTSGDPANDIVKDFTEGQYGVDANADRLDLSELLRTDSTDKVDDFIFAEQRGESTILHVKSDGGLTTNGDNADQQIVLENVSMGDKTSSQFLDDLIAKGQLNID